MIRGVIDTVDTTHALRHDHVIYEEVLIQPDEGDCQTR